MAERQTYLSKEESFMYDREAYFPMEDTRNEARLEYTAHGMTNLSSCRCEVIKISRSSAVLAMNALMKVPPNFYLDVPSARINMIGCVVKRVHGNNVIEARFLRLIEVRDLNRIFVYSTHPNHRKRTLNIYG